MSCINPMKRYHKPLPDHFQLTDAEFESQFEKGELSPKLFSHEAHLRLAWIYIQKHGEERASEKISREIQQFDRIHGDGTKFNATVTVAAVKMVNHFIQKSTADNFNSFIGEYPRLKTSFKDLLEQHYKMNMFTNEEAKFRFVEPDLLPFV